MNMTLFRMNAVFDINCPWCYIGHVYLSRAISSRKALFPKDSFNITLVSSYLKPPPQLLNREAPLFPVQTQSRQLLREETYGKGYADSVLQNIKHATRKAGLPLKFNGMTGTTRNGHRLIQHAQQVGGSESAESTLHDLFKLYHEDEVDITQLEVLKEVGVKNGLGSSEMVEKYLLSGEDGQLVDDLAEGHTGSVPWFEVWNEQDPSWKRQVSGAQSDVVWLDIFDKLAPEGKTSNAL